MSSEDLELFDPTFLSRLRTLFFKLRKRRQLRRKGIQPTPVAGFTREFKDYRHYVAGDDYRTIDWRLFARHERMFIRIFEEAQEFHVHLLLDRSRSMIEPFSEKRINALRLAAALAYLALIGQHRVSILTLADDIRRETQPLKGQGHIHSILTALTELEFEGTTDLQGSLSRFRPGRDRKGIVFVISDLFGKSPESSRTALTNAISWPAETHVVHVLDTKELKPDLEGEIMLQDVETNEVRRMWLTKREMAGYTRALEKYMEDLESTCMARQIDYVPWTTDLHFEDMFLALLSRGSTLAGA